MCLQKTTTMKLFPQHLSLWPGAMKKQILSMSVALLYIVGMAGANSADAQVLTINTGSTLDINGGTLDVNCFDILVKNGGVLILQAGKLLEKNILGVQRLLCFLN